MTIQNQIPNSREPVISRNVLIVLVVLALVVRLLWLIFGNPVIQEEGVYYARMAENLAKGKLFLSLDERKICLTEQPLFILLSAGLNYLGINSELAGQLISVAFGSALVVPMAMIALRLYGRQVAYIAATLVALHPFLIGLSTCVLSEMTYLFWLMSGLYLVYSSLDGRNLWRLSISGVFFGLAYLTRVEGLALPFLAILFLCLIRCWSPRNLLLGSLAILAPFFVLAAPYILFLSVHAGHFAVEGKFKANNGRQYSILKGTSQEEFLFKIDDTLEAPKAPAQMAKSEVTFKDRILSVLKAGSGCIKSLVNRLEDAVCLGEPVLLGFVVLGIFGSKWNQERLANESLLLLVVGVSGVAYFIGAPLPFVSRHLATFLCILLIWAAKGVRELSVWGVDSFGLKADSVAVDRAFNPAVCAIPIALLLTVSLVGTVGLDSYDIKGNVIDKQVGRWIKDEISPEGTMMDTRPIAAYYSGFKMIPFPYCDSATALKYIQKTGVGIIILRTTDTGRPYLKSWIESGVPDDRAKLVNTVSGQNGCIVKIYRWQPDSGHTS